MRLVCWNILHGGSSRRLPLIALGLAELRPDVVVLTEFHRAKGGSIRAVLADLGLTHQADSHGHAAHPAAHPTAKNGILIASRWELKDICPGPTETLGADAPRWLEACVRPGSGWPRGLWVGGLHIPDDSRPTARARVWGHVLGRARVWKDADAVLAGDWNSGRHFVDEPGATFSCTANLGRLWTMGYRDAFESGVGRSGGVRGATWIAPAGWMPSGPASGDSGRDWARSRDAIAGLPQGKAGFRIDAVHLSSSVAAGAYRLEQADSLREMGISDHSALMVELGAPGEGV